MFHRRNNSRRKRMLDLQQIFQAIQAAILAIVLHRLMQPGMIFDFWGNLIARKQWDWPAWVRNPLGECFTCFSGQVGLWTGIAFEIIYQTRMIIIFEPDVNPAIAALGRIVFHTAATIYFADILNFNAGNKTT